MTGEEVVVDGGMTRVSRQWRNAIDGAFDGAPKRRQHGDQHPSGRRTRHGTGSGAATRFFRFGRM